MDDVDALLADLAEWAAAGRADDAAQSRARERWLRQLATEEAQLAGLVADLADHATPVIVRTTAGRTHRGRVTTAGADVLVIAGESRVVLVPLDAVAVLQPAAGATPTMPATAARARSPLTLVGAMARLAQTGTRVMLGTGGEVLSGEVAAVGEDVVSVATDERGVVYVRIGAVTDVVVPRPAGGAGTP